MWYVLLQVSLIVSRKRGNYVPLVPNLLHFEPRFWNLRLEFCVREQNTSYKSARATACDTKLTFVATDNPIVIPLPLRSCFGCRPCMLDLNFQWCPGVDHAMCVGLR